MMFGTRFWIHMARRIAAPEQAELLKEMATELSYIDKAHRRAFARGCLMAVLRDALSRASVMVRRGRKTAAIIATAFSLSGLLMAGKFVMVDADLMIGAWVGCLSAFYLYLAFLLYSRPDALKLIASLAVAGGSACLIGMTVLAEGASASGIDFRAAITLEMIAVMAVFLAVANAAEWIETKAQRKG